MSRFALILIGAAALAACDASQASRPPAPPPLEAAIGIQVRDVRVDRSGIASASVAAINGNDVWVDAFIACTFLDEGRPVGDTMGLIGAIGPRQSATKAIQWASRGQSFDYVECRTSGAYEAR